MIGIESDLIGRRIGKTDISSLSSLNEISSVILNDLTDYDFLPGVKDG